MQQLFYFIQKFRYFLLFLVLEIIALTLTIKNHSYQQSKFINSANFISGGIYNQVSSISDFLNLKSENKRLSEENIRLKNWIEENKQIDINKISTHIDTSKYHQKYQYISAKIINNNYSKRNNFLTLNKGAKQNLKIDLGVINNKGVIGVIKNISKNYATVLSILNSNSRINVRLKKSFHYGTLVWNGKDYNVAQITDIPRQAIIKVGDTIITGGKSAIFPEGINIGVIKDFKFEKNQYKEINISLFNDMSALSYVQVIINYQKNEQKALEQNNLYE
ncbi:MAG: rod shape-determining protein MreC [Lutibacter sp.]|uniref:rod shape-determining protein MreC n=1 Tax=Lutibacter sp. TaxID=1925666 RepID=UPI00299E7306|nr:rod shape-determining protein MreC [Lutibacter sp.]MDX1830352.1 rod shape-determining protein MreC [Lutibacter sp.]